MEGAFSWIQQLWEFIVSCIPHLELQPPDKLGLKIRRRGRVTQIRTGRYWYVPLLTEVREIKCSRRTHDLTPVVLTTEDQKEVAVSAIVVYRIVDAEKALIDTDDVTDAISDMAYEALGAEVVKRSYSQLLESFGDGTLAHELGKRTRAHLKACGVHVEKAFLAELSTKFHRVIGDQQGVIVGEAEEE